MLQELTTGRELFLFMEKVGRLQEWEAAFYAGAVLLAYVFLIPSPPIIYVSNECPGIVLQEPDFPKIFYP